MMARETGPHTQPNKKKIKSDICTFFLVCVVYFYVQIRIIGWVKFGAAMAFLAKVLEIHNEANSLPHNAMSIMVLQI